MVIKLQNFVMDVFIDSSPGDITWRSYNEREQSEEINYCRRRKTAFQNLKKLLIKVAYRPYSQMAILSAVLIGSFFSRCSGAITALRTASHTSVWRLAGKEERLISPKTARNIYYPTLQPLQFHYRPICNPDFGSWSPRDEIKIQCSAFAL